jgi:hypothetical protein
MATIQDEAFRENPFTASRGLFPCFLGPPRGRHDILRGHQQPQSHTAVYQLEYRFQEHAERNKRGKFG